MVAWLTFVICASISRYEAKHYPAVALITRLNKKVKGEKAGTIIHSRDYKMCKKRKCTMPLSADI